MSYKHLAAGFLALAASFGAFAATVAERSPFTQGHWWNPQRPGMGLELFNVGETGAATWYTYESDGRAVWYTAQGPLDGSEWPLMKHRWAEGRKQAPAPAGTLKVTIRHAEKLTLDFSIAGATGSIDIEPFTQSGVPNEVDHSGSYFNPDNSGWGLTFTQQGDIQGGVLYTYDASGAPTWYSGFDRNADNSFAVISARGTCPTCAFAPSITSPAGRIAYSFTGEASMVLRNQVTVPMAPGVALDGASVKQLGRPASTRPADRQLALVNSDAALKAYLVAGILNSPPSPGDFSASPPAAAFSTTNLQEADVDEGDLVKTDGRYVYTFAEASVYPTSPSYKKRVSVLRVARVDDGGKALSIVGNVELAAGATITADSAALYVDKGRVVAVTGTIPFSGKSPTWTFPGSWTDGTTRVEILQAGDDGLPKSQWHAQIDGHVLSTRRIGDRLYVVTRHAPTIAGIRYYPANNPADLALASAAPLDDLLPKIRIRDGAPAPLVDARSIYSPPQGARVPVSAIIAVTTIDLAARTVSSLGLLGQADALYVSADNLFLASSRYVYLPDGVNGVGDPSFYTTDIHQVRLAGSAAFVASGTVEGALRSDPDGTSFRLSEADGRLRVVTASNTIWGTSVKNRLTILDRSTIAPGLLRTVSYLPNSTRPETIGKPGETLYGVRFAGDKLYAVSFRRIDPLYVIDLANAADPRITGALEVPGFSEYLHPLPGGLLLGFGRNTVDMDGRTVNLGLQLTLFDVSDAGRPRELQRIVVGKSNSTSPLSANHHAFSMLRNADGTATLGIPARIYDGEAVNPSDPPAWQQFPWQYSGLLRFRLAGTTPATASLQAMEPLVTHRPVPGFNEPLTDPAYMGTARSVLFERGPVYVGGGLFWREDTNGAALGPY